VIDGLVVAIDSSRREGGSVALAEAGTLLTERFHDPSKGYAESFFALLDEALEAAGRTPDQIRALAVVSGPGSFTGLRIGVMTAKSLAFVRELPLHAAGSLELLASRAAHHQTGSVLTLMDAGRDALYAAAFEGNSEHLIPAMEARRIRFDELIALAKGLLRPLRIVPDGSNLLTRITEGEGLESIEASLLNPAPLGGILAQGTSLGRSWSPQVDPVELVPIYLGPSQAERSQGLDLGKEVHRPLPPLPDGGM
jgi:tRNA threonylcarbamoyladenosine biosynthesis protein TsaB